MRTWLVLVVLAVVAVVLLLVVMQDAPTVEGSPRGDGAAAIRTGRIANVIDGDTVDLADGTRIRLAIVDTPEVHGGVEPCGREASAFTRDLVLGERVTVWRPSGAPATDRHGRLLGEVALPDGTSLNVALAAAGLGTVDERYTDEDPDLAARARAAASDAPAPACASAAPTSADPSPTAPATAAPTAAATPAPTPEPVATPAPDWLGTRVLEPGPTGLPPPQPTPDALLPRSVATVDVLPPPTDGAFAWQAAAVDDEVLERSTWHAGCPVAREDLRYVTVTFWGFDADHHTGEVLVHADAVDAVVAIFAAMHEARVPLEEVRVITDDDLDAPPTGDGNVTSAFVCRDSRGGGWSEHAYGRALDVNPFHNPYDAQRDAGRVVLPELATAYTDRDLGLPGMLVDGHPVVAAARDAGWHWGGDYRSLSDPMHLSATGR